MVRSMPCAVVCGQCVTLVSTETISEEAVAKITFPVEAGHIMLFARAIGDTNPVYQDADAAKRTEVGSIIAPPTFPQAVSQFDPDYPLRWAACRTAFRVSPAAEAGRCTDRGDPARQYLGTREQACRQAYVP